MHIFKRPEKSSNPFRALQSSDGEPLPASDLVAVEVKNAEGGEPVIYAALGFRRNNRIEFQVVAMEPRAAHQLHNALRSAVSRDLKYQPDLDIGQPNFDWGDSSLENE